MNPTHFLLYIELLDTSGNLNLFLHRKAEIQNFEASSLSKIKDLGNNM